MPAFFENPLSALTSTWRIFHEESVFLNPRDERSDFEELRGVKDSRIYRHGDGVLAVSSDDGRLQLKLRDLLGIPREPRPVNAWWGKEAPCHLPRAKTGSVLLFPDALLDTVAGAIWAKHRRQYTPEQLEAAQESAARLNADRKRTAHVDGTDLEPTISPLL